MSFWTPETFKDLKARVARGDSASDIAKAFNEIYKPATPMTRNSITGKVHRSGLVLGQSQGSPAAIQRRLEARKAAAKASNERVYAAKKAGVTRKRAVALKAPEPARVAPISTAPSALAVAFTDRKPGQCAYIWDKNPTAHSLCCGAPIKPGARLSYCEAHHKRVMVPSRPIDKRGVAA